MRVLRSRSRDVFENLAAEEALLEDTALEVPCVFIYRNDSAVVLGKNQNPWKECAVSRLEAMGVALARRVTGGGTVFHDAGNLNIACILSRNLYRRDEVLSAWAAGLSRLGIRAGIEGTTSLAVGGRKVSGNAFCYRRDRVLHHGTLLWDSDLELLRDALVPELPGISTRAVASLPMPVVNLSTLLPGRTLDDVEASVLAGLSNYWGSRASEGSVLEAGPDHQQRIERLRSWAWRFGTTPDFHVALGGVDYDVHRGMIRGCSRPELVGHPFHANG